jgi:hypothetical protein
VVEPSGAPVALRFNCSLDEDEIAQATRELLRRVEGAPSSFGYVLGVEDAMSALPAVASIDAQLRHQIDPTFDLSFVKIALAAPPQASEGVHYAGFHLDTHPAIQTEHGVELDRVLVNLGSMPRPVRFARTTRHDLAARGLPIHRGDYQVVDLPADVDVTTTVIPPRDADVVHGLNFLASVVPHVGVDDERGYFLASYERCAPAAL